MSGGLGPLGAFPRAEGTVLVRVWAPAPGTVEVELDGRSYPLRRTDGGVWEGVVPGSAGSDYVFLLDGERRPDPCSRWQPGGVLGPSRALDPAGFPWTDGGWTGLDLERLVLYELHVGTFTAEGTFDAVVPHLPGLRELGVTAIELMPVATFPGDRGWGYDGLYTSAPHQAYGGPEALARLVDAAHAAGLGVVLDVVYNHIGPGSEALAAFGPYFTDRHRTFWGDGLNYDGAGCEGVREWAIQNAILWASDYHVDGLRLDAVHAVVDDSPRHVLAELADRVRAARPGVLVISEMGHEDFSPLTRWGHDAMWLDNLHHALHVALTGERDGYYEPWDGTMASIARELRRPEGAALVVCAQNHDQVGNRALGDRLEPARLRVAAAACLFSPFTPLLFQGEEYAERRPFRFFTDHVDPAIAEATRAGRRREFERFSGFRGEIPDPQDRATFERSKLDRSAADAGHRALYAALLRLRGELPRRLDVVCHEAARTLELRRGTATLVLDFRAESVELHR